jgi:hypothetical protein
MGLMDISTKNIAPTAIVCGIIRYRAIVFLLVARAHYGLYVRGRLYGMGWSVVAQEVKF